MNCEQANNISTIEFLGKLNINPIKKTGKYTFYYSPFRQEKKPSFAVNNKNRWRDFGSGKRGTLVDLVMELNTCNISQALKLITNASCSLSFMEHESIIDSKIKIRNIRSIIKHTALLEYLKYRAIVPFNLVSNELKEVWYTKESKLFFGIAFENDLGGYEMRNKIFKNCIGIKTITSKLYDSKTIILVEGFFDYLSFLVLFKATDSYNYLILNSTSMYETAIPILKKHEKVFAYLDNDNTGRDCFYKIKKEVPWMIDQSYKYYPFKDLNELLMFKK